MAADIQVWRCSCSCRRQRGRREEIARNDVDLLKHQSLPLVTHLLQQSHTCSSSSNSTSLWDQVFNVGQYWILSHSGHHSSDQHLFYLVDLLVYCDSLPSNFPIVYYLISVLAPVGLEAKGPCYLKSATVLTSTDYSSKSWVRKVCASLMNWREANKGMHGRGREKMIRLYYNFKKT